MKIRKEELKDYDVVHQLIKNAFADEQFTNHKEHFLVEKLRKSAAFVPDLSIVAEIQHEIIGYILLTEIKIIGRDNQQTKALAMAPVAVLKEYRGKGIGGKLIEAAHQIARELHYGSVILLGHENYYPKFGYTMTKNYGIELSFGAPDANCMLIELTENALQNVQGIVEYPKEFYE